MSLWSESSTSNLTCFPVEQNESDVITCKSENALGFMRDFFCSDFRVVIHLPNLCPDPHHLLLVWEVKNSGKSHIWQNEPNKKTQSSTCHPSSLVRASSRIFSIVSRTFQATAFLRCCWRAIDVSSPSTVSSRRPRLPSRDAVPVPAIIGIIMIQSWYQVKSE